MSLSTLRCPNCGNAEQIRKQQLGEDILYYCPSCASEFYERLAKREYERLHSAIKSDVGSMIDEAVLNMKLEEYYNLRSMLCKEATAEYIDSKAIVKICRDILKSFPDDCIANFFLTANSGTRQEVADAINEIDAQENEASMGLVLNFMIKSLKEEYVDAMAALLERCGKIFSPEKKQEYFTKFEKEAKKVREGIYEIGLSRDVFLAYSSKDMPAVIKLLNFIESSEIGLTCFAAFRNLQHGRDAVADYDRALKEAMNNCSIFLFVSSVNSRNINCDAFKVEMAYIKNSEMKQHPECRSYAQLPEKYRKLRIEYRLDNRPTPLVDRNMKEFFAGLTYVEDHDQLLIRLGECLDKLSEPYSEECANNVGYKNEAEEKAASGEVKEESATYGKIDKISKSEVNCKVQDVRKTGKNSSASSDERKAGNDNADTHRKKADNKPSVSVVGIGGGGRNAVMRMICSNKLTFTSLCIQSPDGDDIFLNDNLVFLDYKKVLSCDDIPLNDRVLIDRVTENSEVVVLCAGLGGNTGTNLIPIMADYFKNQGKIVIAVVTKPFKFEGARRMQKAEEGASLIKRAAHFTFFASNEQMKNTEGIKVTLANAFEIVDNVALECVTLVSRILESRNASGQSSTKLTKAELEAKLRRVPLADFIELTC